MKILFVARVYRHLTVFHLPHIKYFQSLGFEVWAASGEGEYDKKLLENLGVKCVDISFSRKSISLRHIQAIKQMRNLLKVEKFDFIDVHTPISAFITRYAAKKFPNTKVIYTAHGFHFYKGAPVINWLLYYTAEKIAAGWTEHIITINNEDYNQAKKLGISKEKVSLIHGVGVEINSEIQESTVSEQLKEEFLISDEDVVIAYIAELNSNKNHMFLLRNWKVIKRKAPKVKLLIIGQGSKENELKNYIKQENLEDVIFTGYRRDVNDILKVTQIVTLLSKREGLPKSIMEAMSSELPCIVSNTRGLRDLIINNKNGFVVNLNDDKSLSDMFIKLVNDNELRAEFGKQSKKLVEPYLLDNVLNEYAHVYKNIISD